MIKRELAKDPNLKNENWERFLPKFKKKNVRKKPVKKEKKEYTPFPPPQKPRKEDLELESGEYFLSKEQKEAKQEQAKKEKQKQVMLQKYQAKEKEFIPPKVIAQKVLFVPK